jgi:hypothetical protein
MSFGHLMRVYRVMGGGGGQHRQLGDCLGLDA